MRVQADRIANGRITQLDGWRGISILLVIFGHLLNFRYAPPGLAEIPFPIAGLLSTWGVYVFFVISGFIITRLALAEQDLSGRFSAKSFYIRRFFRIVPPFFAYLAFILLVTSAGLISNRYTQTLMAATFTCNMAWSDCGWFSIHSWSLAFEEQFYLLFPVLLWLGGRRTGLLFGVLFVFLVSTPFLRQALQLGDGWRVMTNFALNFVFICAGATMASCEHALKELSQSPRGRHLTYCAALSLAGLAYFLCLRAAPGTPLAYLQLSLSLILVPVCIAWLVGSSIHQGNLLGCMLNSGPLQFVGAISYSLYLWQQMFVAVRSNYPVDSWLLFPPAMFAFAIASYYFIERPSVRLGKRLLAESRPIGPR